MMKKRGISPIIATVLLLGFAVALATTVFLWMSGQTETMSKSTVEYAEGEMQCQNVRINLVKSDDISCANLDVSNKGYITINQLAIRAFNPEGSSLYLDTGPEDNFLQPQSSECKPPGCGIKKNVPTPCSSCKKLEVMPIINIGDRQVGCKDRAVVIEC